MDRIGIGLVGTGFAADLHARMYRELTVLGSELVALASRSRARAEDFARWHGISVVADDYAALLARDDVDIVDLCVPNYLHKEFVIRAAEAGKHVICEKPLTGYFGQGEEKVGETPRSRMLEVALRDADEMIAACARHGVKLMYAENWVYAPAITKVKRLLRTSGATIFEIRAEESHHGSQSPYSLHWRYTGGGSLLRLGAHPLGAMLHLKKYEGLWRDGKPIIAHSVLASVGDLTRVPSFQRDPTEWIVQGWEDVETWATAILTFSDGSRGIVFASDLCLGGLKNTLEIYASNARLQCNLSRSNLLEAYAPDPSIFGEEYIVEKLETKAGWSFPSVDEDWMLGYGHELRDFIEAVKYDREPLSGAGLARDVVNVIYSAYLSAERGCLVTLENTPAKRG